MKISLVVPVFNEEETIAIFHQAVREHPALQAFDIDILFINDGSTDRTGSMVEALIARDPRWGWSASPATSARNRHCSPGWNTPRAMP